MICRSGLGRHLARWVAPGPVTLGERRDGQPKAERVYAALREAIITMRLPPGSRLVEREICADLGVSRTPVREAVMRLAGQRLVTVVPSDQTYVNKIILEEVVEGALVRESLELRFAEMAARHFDAAFAEEFEILLWRQEEAARHRDVDASFMLDSQFHRLLCQVSGFPQVWNTIHETTGQLDRVRHRAFPLEDYYGEVIDDHRAIVAALRIGDPDGVTRTLGPHLKGNLTSLNLLMKREPDLVAHEPDSIASMMLAVHADPSAKPRSN